MSHFLRQWAAALCALGLLFLSASPGLAVTGLPVPPTYTPSDMVLKVNITAPNTLVEMPLSGTVSNVNINWGDGEGTGPFNVLGNQGHTYANVGEYTIVISGSLSWFGLEGWYSGVNTITEVVQWGSLGITKLRHAFLGASNLIAVPSDLPVGVTDLSNMFVYASRFNDDVSTWDTSTVTNMQGTFALTDSFNNGSATNDFAHPLRTVGNAWNVSNVTNMESMFSDARAFNQDVSNWDTSAATTMSGMFWNNFVFNSDISGWNTANVTTMSGMFWACWNFNQNLSAWNTAKVTNMSGMFRGATRFNNGSLANDQLHPLTTSGSSWNLAAVTRIDGMFMGAEAFNQDIGNWDVSNVTMYEGMFDGAIRFNQNISSWNTVGMTQSAWMFRGATAFNNGNQPWSTAAGDWDFSRVGDAGYMFADARAFNQDISGWDTSSLGNTGAMFAGATSFNNGGAPLRTNGNKWNTSKLVWVHSMFSGATAFNADIGNWDVGGIDNMAVMFAGCEAFNQDLSAWNVAKVTNMYAMFSGAKVFNQNLNSWNTGAVTNMESMFERATAFNGFIGSWNTSSLVNTYAMFHYASAFNQDIGNWDMSKVTNMSHMFRYATSFNQDLGRWNTGLVLWFGQMFAYSGFDQDIGAWETASVYDAGDMFTGGVLSRANYDKLLVGWAGNNNRTGVNFSAGAAKYSASSIAARTTLTGTGVGQFGWYIADGGEAITAAVVTTTPTAGNLVYGQALSEATLIGGVANVPGVFSFTNPATVPNAGTANQSVTFTPTDTTIPPITLDVSVSVLPAAQTLTWNSSFNSVTTGAYMDQFTVAASSSASLPVTFSASGGCTVVGSTVTLTSASVACVVTASQAGNSNYAAATEITHTITTAKAPMPQIIIGTAGTLTYNPTTPATALMQISGGTGIGIRSFVIPTGDPCSVTDALGIQTITALGAGTCRITLEQSGNEFYLPGSSNQLVLTIAKAAPTVNFAAASTNGYLGIAFSSPTYLTNSDGAVSFVSSNTNVATVDPNSGAVTLVGVGTATISISVAEATNFLAGSDTYTVSVADGFQALSWDSATTAIAEKSYGDSFEVSATTTSGLVPTYSVSGGCSLSGSTVTMTSGSTDCVITSDQPGSAQFAPAGRISKTVTAVRAEQTAVRLLSSSDSVVFNPAGTAQVRIDGSGGLGTGSLSFAVRVGDLCELSTNGSSATLNATGAGTCRVTATRAGDSNYAQSASTVIDVTVTKAPAVLKLNNPPKVGRFGETVARPDVELNSNGKLRFTSSDPTVVDIDSQSGAIQINGVGAAIITVSASETSNFSAAEPVTFEIVVEPAIPAAPSNVRTALNGTTLEVAWDAPTFTGGTPIEKYVAVATANSQSFTCIAMAPATSCIIEGLNPGTNYEVAVEVVVSGGRSPLSSRSGAVTATVPPLVIDPTPEPTPSEPGSEDPVLDDRGLEVVNIAEDDPVAVAQATVKTVALVTAAAAASAAVAAAGAAASAAAGSATGLGGGSSTSSGSGSSASVRPRESSTSGPQSRSERSDDANEVRDLTEEMTSVRGMTTSEVKWGDQLPIWSLAFMTFTDAPTHQIAVRTSKKSPLLAKMILDGGYLRAMIGSLALALPLVSVILGLVGVSLNSGVFLPPTAFVLGSLIVIGTFDVMAATIGISVFCLGMTLTAGISDSADIRVFFGLFAAVITPSLLATSFRAVRRPAAVNSEDWWRRFGDATIAPVLAAAMVTTSVGFLPALGGVEFPIARSAMAMAFAAAVAMVGRVVLEEIAAQVYPARLDRVHPDELDQPSKFQKATGLVLRASIFYFVAEAIVGPGWHLLVGTALFMVPTVLNLFAHRLPNSTRLYQILPTGLPAFAVSLLLGVLGLSVLLSLVGPTANLAQIGFAVLPIPSTAFSVTKLFGREPAEGAVRLSERPSLTWAMRAGGALLVIVVARLLGLI